MTASQDGTAPLGQGAELQTIYEEAPIGLCVLDLEQRFVRVNRRFAEMNGFPPESHIGRSIRDLVPAVADQADALFRRVVQGGVPVTDIEIVGETAAMPGVRRAWRESWHPLRDAAGAVVGITVVAEEITEQRRAAAALRESEQRFRGLANNVPVMIWITDATGYCEFVNQGWNDFTGQSLEEALGLGWLDAVHPDDRAEAERVFRRATARGEPFRLDYRLRRHDGVYRWCIDMGKPRLDGDGRFAGFAGTVVDISERKEIEERQALMMRELDHRAKNMLAAVQAVMRLTKAPDMASFVDSVEGRVQALATAHALIARHRWQGVGVRTLLAEQLAPYRGERVRIEGPDTLATPSAAQALAMIVHELATNAAKYGALSRDGGRIHVDLQPTPDDGIRLTWRESGGPPTVPPTRRGLGTDIIRSSAQTQLDGTVEYDWQPEGLVLRIAIGPGALRQEG